MTIDLLHAPANTEGGVWGAGLVRYHVFISYARKDNEPRQVNGRGWVHLFHDRLEAQYHAFTQHPLEVFLDVERIENGEHWETHIQSALRQSRIFIAVLSPNYLASPICRMELEDYVRHEQSVTPGGDGVRPIYFATAADLEGSDLDLDDSDRARLIKDLLSRNRNKTLDWRDWRSDGLQALLGLDAQDRLDELDRNPQPPLDTFVNGIDKLSRDISERLDDVALAELARGHGNLSQSHVNFVGRSIEIAEIHRNLIHNHAQLVTALHGLGGQGKSALARQYAHAYASYYAAGGRWEIDCEGLGKGIDTTVYADRCTPLALSFEKLTERMAAHAPHDPRFARLRLSPDDQKLASPERLKVTLARLRAFTVEGWDDRLAALRAGVAEVHGIWPKTHHPRLLVIFDNVDTPGLLNAKAYDELQGPDWLEMIITTRLAPSEIGDAGRDKSIRTTEVNHLPLGDAVELIRKMLRGTPRAPLDKAERQAVRDLAGALGGFTLAVELAGAYLATYPTVKIAGYLRRLQADGIVTVDQAKTEGSKSGVVSGLVRHREGQIGLILTQTLEGLTPVEIDVLHIASHFAPDHVVLDWLRAAEGKLHPDLLQAADDRENPWDAVVARLTGRRLLTETEVPGTCRLHRIVREHLRRIAGSDRRGRDRDLSISLAAGIGRAMEAQGTGWRAQPAAWRPVRPPFAALIDTLVAEGPAEARILRQLGGLADFETTAGSFSRAEQVLVRYLALAQALARDNPGDALARDNPGDALARRDLSVSQNKIGDFYLRRGAPGGADRALAAYQASLDTREALARDKPVDAQARRDLSVSQNKIGDFYLRRGAPGGADRALAAYQASLDTREALARDNPVDAQARRDLSVSQNKIGDFYLRGGRRGCGPRARGLSGVAGHARGAGPRQPGRCAGPPRPVGVAEQDR
jgi:hypothetical protein